MITVGVSFTPELRAFCDRVIVPALLERFRAEQATRRDPNLTKPDVTVPAAMDGLNG